MSDVARATSAMRVNTPATRARCHSHSASSRSMVTPAPTRVAMAIQRAMVRAVHDATPSTESTRISPEDPSTRRRRPRGTGLKGSGTPTTTGTRDSRARIARWESTLPVSRPGPSGEAGAAPGRARACGRRARRRRAGRCRGGPRRRRGRHRRRARLATLAAAHDGTTSPSGAEPEGRRQRRPLGPLGQGATPGGATGGDREPGRGGRGRPPPPGVASWPAARQAAAELPRHPGRQLLDPAGPQAQRLASDEQRRPAVGHGRQRARGPAAGRRTGRCAAAAGPGRRAWPPRSPRR